MRERLRCLPSSLGRCHSARSASGIAAGIALLIGGAPSHAEPWKNCAYNDRPIPCRDSHSSDGSVRILWQDGKTMTYRLIQEGFPLSTLRDRLGGLWEREIHVQGNAVFTNRANGNRIFVPLHL